MSTGKNAPIIIKRKKVMAGDGHHGGAWKVAYADFVTAMMAFFLLMWLLNATTEQQRKGLADYFAPSIPVTRVSGGGDGMFGGDSIFSDGAYPHSQFGPPSGAPTDGGVTTPDDSAAEVATLEALEDRLLGIGGESLLAEQALRHVVTRLTDEGLIIEIFAREGAPIFEGETDEPMPVLRDLASVLANVFDMVANPVAINGYTRSRPVVMRSAPAFDLSLQRAAMMRTMLLDEGLNDRRMARLTGHGDRAPVGDDALGPRNDRIEIILLRTSR